jgi:uncharacterized protein
MREVFVDSSFWIAYRGANQIEHTRACELARRLVAERTRLVTTYLAFAEIHAAFARKSQLRAQVVNDFTSGFRARIENPELGDYSNAFVLLRQHHDKAFSFCDAVSFVVMRRLSLSQALSLDGHFRQIGEFEILE